MNFHIHHRWFHTLSINIIHLWWFFPRKAPFIEYFKNFAMGIWLNDDHPGASCGAFSRSARRKLIPSSMRAGGRELVAGSPKATAVTRFEVRFFLGDLMIWPTKYVGVPLNPSFSEDFPLYINQPFGDPFMEPPIWGAYIPCDAPEVCNQWSMCGHATRYP